MLLMHALLSSDSAASLCQPFREPDLALGSWLRDCRRNKHVTDLRLCASLVFPFERPIVPNFNSASGSPPQFVQWPAHEWPSTGPNEMLANLQTMEVV